MKFILRILPILFLAAGLRAADFQVTGILVITNPPAGLTTNLVANIGTSTTRNWTNDASGAPGTSIQTTNSTAASATNLHTHLNDYPVYSVGSSGPRLLVSFSATNTSALELAAPRNTNITVTFGGNWGYVTYVTNVFAGAAPIMTQTNALSAEQRTNAQNAVVNLLSAATVASNSIPPGKPFLKHYSDNTSAQTSSNKTFVAPVVQGGRIVNATNITGTNVAFTNVTIVFVINRNGTFENVLAFFGTNVGAVNIMFTNGFTSAITNINPVFSNAVNYGSAISSEGAAGNTSQQFGYGAYAGNSYTTAVGYDAAALDQYGTAVGRSAVASNVQDTAIGYGTLADGQFSTALGAAALATNGHATALGAGAEARGNRSVALGAGSLVGADAQYGVAIGSGSTGAKSTNGNGIAIGAVAVAGHTNTVALGRSARAIHSNSMVFATFTESTAADQVTVGSSSQTVSIPGVLAVAGTTTDSTFTGTNVLNGRLDLTPRANTTLANGYNSGVVFGTNSYIRFSGPSAAYTNAGFAAPGGPQYVLAQFDNPGLSFTMLDESGLEATAGNRILTGTGALLNSTNNPVMAAFLYDNSASRWRVLSFR